MLLKEKEINLDQELLKYINNKVLNKSSENINSNKINKDKNILIKNKISFNDMNNNSRNINYYKINYNTLKKNTEEYTTQKILKQLKRNESELTKDLSKLIQNEKMIKDKSYLQLVNENTKNVILEKNKLQLELKQIYENKNIYLSRLNEIKYRINSIEDKYIKAKGIYSTNRKEKLTTFLHNQINLNKNDKTNARLKLLQKQNNKLLLNMNKDSENKIKEKEFKLKLEKEQEIENNLKILKQKREEEKKEVSKRKNKINEEKKKVEEYIYNKPEIKEYYYQKKNSAYNRKIDKIISLENKKRKNNLKTIELSNMNDFRKNYENIKLKKQLELDQKTKGLIKSWSERGLMISKYKNELSNLIDEEEKNKQNERQMLINKKIEMKNKQINYSKKFENDLMADNKQNGILSKDVKNKRKNKNNQDDYYRPNIKLKSMNNYCNSIRKKLLTKKENESKSLLNIKNIKPNHIDLTKNQNSYNIIKTPDLKLPNLNMNNKNIIQNNEINYPKITKNPQSFKLKKSNEIQNIIEKNGINETTLEIVNTKLDNLKEKKEQKDLLLKYQGGIASNPDLGEEVCDMLIDSMNAKMSLIDNMKKIVKKGNKKNLVDKGTGIIEYNESEENQEEYENQD